MVLDGGILGALHQQRSPPVRLEQPSGLADAHLGVYVRLYENGEMPHIAGKKLSQFLHQTRHISLYFTTVIQTYAFVKEFHFFCEDCIFGKNRVRISVQLPVNTSCTRYDFSQAFQVNARVMPCTDNALISNTQLILWSHLMLRNIFTYTTTKQLAHQSVRLFLLQ